MTRRDRILSLAHEGRLPDEYVPAAFFMHFPASCHRGQAAVSAHADYFRSTGNDLVKVQYERNYPRLDTIRRPSDWSVMPCYGEEFYADQLDLVAGVAAELRREAVVVVTLYSPFMFAAQTVGVDVLERHLCEDPEAVARGLAIIVESMRGFVRGCIERGADGFYASTQGGEEGRAYGPEAFDGYVKPADLAVWDEFAGRTECDILHVCDYEARYASLDRYLDYPGRIVSAPVEFARGALTGREVAARFGRPFLGGMDRLGPISAGPPGAAIAAARAALEEGPAAMILGADCTLLAGADPAVIRSVTDTAHRYRRDA